MLSDKSFISECVAIVRLPVFHLLSAKTTIRRQSKINLGKNRKPRMTMAQGFVSTVTSLMFASIVGCSSGSEMSGSGKVDQASTQAPAAKDEHAKKSPAKASADKSNPRHADTSQNAGDTEQGKPLGQGAHVADTDASTAADTAKKPGPLKVSKTLLDPDDDEAAVTVSIALVGDHGSGGIPQTVVFNKGETGDREIPDVCQPDGTTLISVALSVQGLFGANKSISFGGGTEGTEITFNPTTCALESRLNRKAPASLQFACAGGEVQVQPAAAGAGAAP